MPTPARVFCTARPYRMLAARMVLPWALQGLRPGGQVLEIGAGSGAMAARLLGMAPGLHVTVTDYDPLMVSVAAESLAAHGDRVAIRQADAAELPFSDGGFDCVLSFAMLHHVIDWEAAVREAVRVLAPGGRLVGYDIVDSPVMRVLHHAEGGEIRMMRPGQLEAELRRLPLADVRTRRSGAGLAVRFAATKRS